MANFAEKNRQVFDKMAGSYLEGFAQAIQSIIRQVQNRRLWLSDQWTDTAAGSGKELKMLEYACGPGAISMTLVPYVTKILGLDLSDNMVNEYNKNAEQNGYSNKMSARTGDLLTDPVPTELSGPEYFGFDIVVVSMALHHFDDASKALRYLGDRLKKGGTCIIIDIVPDHLSDHHHNHIFGETAHTVRTHGFTLEQMRELFTNAGMEANFGYQVLDEPAVFQMDGKSFSKTLFMARAQRT